MVCVLHPVTSLDIVLQWAGRGLQSLCAAGLEQVIAACESMSQWSLVADTHKRGFVSPK